MLTLNTWLRWYLLGFSTVTSFSLEINKYLREDTLSLCQYAVSPQILTNFCSHSWVFFFFPETMLSWYFNGDFLLLLFLSFIYLYKYRLIHDFNIFHMGYSPILSLLFMLQIVPDLATENFFRLAPVRFGYGPIFFGAPFQLLSPSNAPGSSCVFPATVLESTTPPRITVSLFFFFLQIYLLV